MNSHSGSRGLTAAVAAAATVTDSTDRTDRAVAAPAAAATTAAITTKEGTTLLTRCWSWHDPLGTTARISSITGAASASTSISKSRSSASASANARLWPRFPSRSKSRSRSRSSWVSRAVIFTLLSCWCLISTAAAAVAASPSSDEPRRLRPTLTLTEADTSADTDSEQLLLIDTRIPVFVDGHWQIMSGEEHGELRRRAAAPKEAPQATTTTEVVIDTSTVTAAADPPTTTTAAASPLPSPFDGALAANFSAGQSCPNFINAFLSNATFKACYPVSLLLQGSQSFFMAEKSFFSITQVLDAACKADVEMCTAYFDDLADSLIADGNCGQEYKLENALVLQAYQGMKTYETVYKATCLTNADADSLHYCFANAITNASTPSNAYLYYLPFNSTLPPTAAPACGSCTQQTMEIYQAATSNRKADISNTYTSAAKQINSECGENFVNTTLAAVTVPSAAASLNPASSSSLLLLSFVFMAISRWML
ncbi:hypothetical protein F4859DRAFT_431273 [Xylaria cf. heliscus]|nr:hypothetical protein F4859DRAFT_431273 [Xylaria cf. heliscus]